MESSATISVRTLQEALNQRYPKTKSALAEVDEQTLLRVLSRLEVADLDSRAILDYIASEIPDFGLSADHHSAIAFLDDCCTSILDGAEILPLIQSSLRRGIIGLIRTTLVEGLVTVSEGHGLLTVLDRLINLAIGCTDISDKQHMSIIEYIQSSIASLLMISESQITDPHIKQSRDTYLTNLSAEIAAFSAKDQERIARLEERLIASETGLIETKQARNLAARMLNNEMANHLLPQSIIDFMQDPWYNSLQLILIRQGIKSDAWVRASKLTETLIWTLEFDVQQQIETPVTEHQAPELSEAGPDDPANTLAEPRTSDDTSVDLDDNSHQPADSDKVGDSETEEVDEESGKELQRFYRIIEHLRDEINTLLVSLEYQPDRKKDALSVIESAHICIATGTALEAVAHTPLPCDSELLKPYAALSQALLSQVHEATTGEWFVFEAKDKSPQQIKLVLKLDDMQQLLFTNRSGMKVLQLDFEEFAYFLSAKIARPIPSAGELSTHIRNNLNGIVTHYLAQQNSAAAATKKSKLRQAARRASVTDSGTKVDIDQPDKEKQEEFQSSSTFLPELREQEHAEQQVAKPLAVKRIAALRPGAWVRIQAAKQQAVICRFAVKPDARDRYIFVDRTGQKLIELSTDQLTDLVVANECKLLDVNAELEDTLEKVVYGLRAHRSTNNDSE